MEAPTWEIVKSFNSLVALSHFSKQERVKKKSHLSWKGILKNRR